MQLDLFAHSRDVVLRNDVIAALRMRDRVLGGQTLARLSAEYPRDSLLMPLATLLDTLATPAERFPDHNAVADALRTMEMVVVPCANLVFGPRGAGVAGAGVAIIGKLGAGTVLRHRTAASARRAHVIASRRLGCCRGASGHYSLLAAYSGTSCLDGRSSLRSGRVGGCLVSAGGISLDRRIEFRHIGTSAGSAGTPQAIGRFRCRL